MPDALVALAQRLEDLDFRSPEFLAHLTADVTFEAAGSRELLPWAGVWKGPEGLSAFRNTLGSRITYTSWKSIAWYRDGDTVIEQAHASGKAKASGAPFESDILRLWVFREGKVARITTSYDTLSYAIAIGAVTAGHDRPR